MGLRIAVTGYFGAGSSAVLDLLSEYNNTKTGLPEDHAYEHITFYTPGGLFDLEDKLLLGNDIHRSDEAINTFTQEMKKLNQNNFGWFGSFRHMFGDSFNQIYMNLINDLGVYKIKARYYGQYKKVQFSLIKCIFQIGGKIFLKRKIYKWGRQYFYNDWRPNMKIAFPNDETFYGAARKFVTRYMDLFGDISKNNILFDRLLLCHNAYRLPRYFDDTFRLIIVERDVRDLYILNKYIWPKIHAGSMFPKNLQEFIRYWKQLNASEKRIEDRRILRIKFEDLIYNYEETVLGIEEFCELKHKEHIWQKKYFQPERSIKNTQVFLMNEEWNKEIKVIEQELKEYLYGFPYGTKTDIKNMFDDSRA